VSSSFPIAINCQIKELVLNDFNLRLSHSRSGKPLKKANQRVNLFHTLLCSGYAPQNARVFGRLNFELDHPQCGNYRRGLASDHLKRSALYRASCLGIEVRLRVEPDCAWLVAKRPGAEAEYHDIPSAEIPRIVERFLSIGEDPEKFNAFLSAAAAVGQK